MERIPLIDEDENNAQHDNPSDDEGIDFEDAVENLANDQLEAPYDMQGPNLAVIQHDEDVHPERPSSASRFSFGFRRKIVFDPKLPAAHSYLGSDLEEVECGRSFHEDGSIVDGVILFPLPHVILMPGQTLPLQQLHPRAVALLRQIIANHHVFGVVSARLTDEGQELSNIGTLAQVVAFKDDTEHEISTVKCRTIGRQRFEILETQRLSGGAFSAKIKILPEIVLPPALSVVETSITHRSKATSRGRRQHGSRKNDEYFAARLTSIPEFVFKQYDVVEICASVRQHLSEWYNAERVEALSKNPVNFSFWVAANLPIDDQMKVKLLSINCAEQRLRWELSLLQKCTVFCCSECAQEIGHKSNVMSMSVDGPMGAYVNAHGFIHETLTLKAATGVSMIGRQTTENSWFPGYAWRILQCSQCSSHLGWRFKAVKRGLEPKCFWGITRSAIVPTISNDLDTCHEESSPLIM